MSRARDGPHYHEQGQGRREFKNIIGARDGPHYHEQGQGRREFKNIIGARDGPHYHKKMLQSYAA